MRFYVGLCMADAVSAGSYTAGVMDFLLEALEEWDQRRTMPGTPQHQVEIPVIGGASAGGMTSIITAAALEQNLIHIDRPGDDLLAAHPENILYHSWVDLTQDYMFSAMLQPADIENGLVTSALNSDFIDTVANRVLIPEQPEWSAGIPSFITNPLKVFATLTNLQGFLYDVAFKAATPDERKPYFMEIYNDYACFELSDQKNAQKGNPGWIPLSIKGQLNTDTAVNAAMATGAFPVGLKSRIMTRQLTDLNHNPLQDNRERLIPATDDPYEALCVDGGMINNEPFEKVRDILTALTGQKDPEDFQDHKRFKSTVLMIAPFPSSKPDFINKSQNILHVIGLTLGAMLSQMRAKPANLVDAMNPGGKIQNLPASDLALDPTGLRSASN